MEFRWDNDRDYRKLYYYQTSNIENDRSEWFLTLREKDRKTAILKLTVTVPDYFDSKLKPHRMRICRTSVGSMMSTVSAADSYSPNSTSSRLLHEGLLLFDGLDATQTYMAAPLRGVRTTIHASIATSVHVAGLAKPAVPDRPGEASLPKPACPGLIWRAAKK